MMRARCPACHTVFRVRPEHLRARQGRVRCGHCQTAFNALEHLLEDEAPSATAAGAAEPGAGQPAGARSTSEEPPFTVDEWQPPPGPAASPASPAGAPAGGAPGQASAPTGKTPTVASLADRLDFDIPEALLPPRTPAREAPVPPADAASVGASPAIVPAVIRPAGHHGSPAGESPEAAAGAADTTAARPHETLAFSPDGPQGAAPASAATREAPDTPPVEADEERLEPSLASEATAPQAAESISEDLTAPAPADEAAPPWDTTEEAERLDATYGPAARTGGGRRWLWGVGIGILLGALAVQSAYLFRGEITRTWPALRPLYVAVCAELGCTLPLPRQARHLGIETSDLESEPSGGGGYVLNAVIRNRAAFPQAWPHLELTLTDARDLPAARRVIAPEEWVPQGRLEGGFPAHGTASVRLPFDAPEVAAVGYRVYAFYP